MQLHSVYIGLQGLVIRHTKLKNEYSLCTKKIKCLTKKQLKLMMNLVYIYIYHLYVSFHEIEGDGQNHNDGFTLNMQSFKLR